MPRECGGQGRALHSVPAPGAVRRGPSPEESEDLVQRGLVGQCVLKFLI